MVQGLRSIWADPYFGPLGIITNGITVMASVCLGIGSLYLVSESKYNPSNL